MTRTTNPKRAAAPPSPPADGPWLLPHKVELPDEVLGYVDRPTLHARCSPTARRLTVLHAPGGFGKTALLAHCCRTLRADGVAVAWLSVDEDDGPVSIASYLSLAFEQAGVSYLDSAPGDTGRTARDALPAAADSAAAYRVNLLVRAIHHHREPCVLALDELDRLRNPDAVAVLNAVLDRAPPNLHFALAYRERPRGLDVAMFALQGRAETLTVEDLRFSTVQIARFFDPQHWHTLPSAEPRTQAHRLSRAQLASVATDSAGWPIALRLYSNALQAGSPSDGLGTSDTVAAWIESRLWRGLSAEDRDFVLDIALFDWIDPRLIDEATGRTQSKLRLATMQSLSGLLQTVGREGSAMRLHPLIREYCAAKLFRDNPQRFRSIHIGIASALARRGNVLDALRHAAEAGDNQLIATIAEQAGGGGVKLLARRGTDALRALDGWLTEDMVARSPRLALMRCFALISRGDIEGAQRVYQTAAVESVGFTRDAGGQEDDELRTDHLLALGMFYVLGCRQIANYDPIISAGADFASQPDLNPLLRAAVRLGMSISHNEMAQFDDAVHWAQSARDDAGSAALYLLPHIHFQMGIAAMARGHADEAARRYRRGLNVAQGRVSDTGMVMTGTLLMAELELERTASAPLIAFTPVSARLLGEYAAWFDVYAASVGVASELAWHHGDRDRAMSAIEQARQFARDTDRIALLKLLSAQRVSLLLRDDRTAEAARAWLVNDLPESSEACLDLKTQRWREMEVIACARLRLLTAQGAIEPARELSQALRDTASRRTLLRTLMRALALTARLEFEAGDHHRATAHVRDALDLLARADYARPLAREREAIVPLLERIIASGDTGPVLQSARDVHAALTAKDGPPVRAEPALVSRKEFDVLRRLDSRADKDIAQELGMSYDAVRYYVRKIFSRVGARNRFDAVHRARAMGLLPTEEADDTPGA